ncbi:MAG: hypothetical protein M0P70_15845 [Desulfobulbaceae bacterium]|nr:hypothetical protein [Desulfobulbaceae bacterium]
MEWPQGHATICHFPQDKLKQPFPADVKQQQVWQIVAGPKQYILLSGKAAMPDQKPPWPLHSCKKQPGTRTGSRHAYPEPAADARGRHDPFGQKFTNVLPQQQTISTLIISHPANAAISALGIST